MKFKLENGGVLKINTEPLARMGSYRQETRDKLEAGGVLLGRLIKDSTNIIIDRVTVPMIGDKRSRLGFIRYEKTHQRIITSTWEKSNGTCNYQGEWHTHPEKWPSPSSQDLKNWKNILQTGVFSSLYLYFVIVGIKEIRVWQGNKRTNKIKRLYAE